MIKQTYRFFLLLIIPFFMMMSCRNSININNRQVSNIFVPENADTLTTAAAQGLQQYLSRITGKELKIKDAAATDGNAFYIGKHFLNDSLLSLLSDTLKEDAFLIVSNDNGIYLSGKNPTGDYYAVTTLLEEFLGCMKFNVKEELVPKAEAIVLPEISKVYNPAFTWREEHFPGRLDKDFRLWHKIDDHSIWGLFVHTFDDLIPPDKYFDTHPEYFALVNGRRLRDGQLCLSNPEVINELIKNLGKRIEAEPDKNYWSVSQNDCYNYCECENCKKLYEKYGSFSGAYIQMANQVADAFPDKIISTLAYQFTRSAPKNIRPHDNVNIMFCSIECNRSMPLADDPRSAGFVRDMKNWAKITDNILAWDYVVQFSNLLTPFPNFHVLQPNIRFYRDNGVSMMFQQGSGSSWSDMSDLKQYLIAKLLWNPDINADSAVNRYIDLYYEKAAPFIREYFNLTHDSLIAHQQEQSLNIYGFPVSYVHSFLTPELLLRYRNIMDSAENAVADDSVLLKRVLRARIAVDFATIDIAYNSDAFEKFWANDPERLKNFMAKLPDELDRFVENCKITGVWRVNERNFKPEAYAEYIKQNLKRQQMANKLDSATLKCLTKYSPKYPVGGVDALTDKLMGGLHFRYNWLGFEGEDMIVVADFGRKTTFESVSMNFLKDFVSWIFLPQEITVEVSDDGTHYKEVARIVPDDTDRKYKVLSVPYRLEFPKVSARYLKVSATSIKTCPPWHRGFGKPSWIFCDEIIVE